LTARFVRVFAIGGKFKQQRDSVRGAHSLKRGPPCIRGIRRPVTGTADCVR
jgi:hypothetical protein